MPKEIVDKSIIHLSDKDQRSLDFLTSIQESNFFDISRGRVFCTPSHKTSTVDDYLEAVDFLVENENTNFCSGLAIKNEKGVVEILAPIQEGKSNSRPVILQIEEAKVLSILKLAYRLSRDK